MRIALALIISLAGCGGISAQSPDPTITRHHCSTAFALGLRQGERVTVESQGEDFVVHRVVTPKGELTIYEGNHPQPGGIVKKTGLDWPGVVVTHQAADNPALAGDVASRLAFGKQRRAHCSADAK